MSVSSIPARLQMEPADMVAYDRWQDGEGLLDAADACKDAWARYRSQWRAARNVELARTVETHDRRAWREGLDPYTRKGADRAQRLGAWFGVCSGKRRGELRDDERASYWRWRSRILRHDPDVWWGVWGLVDGEALGSLAMGLNRDPNELAGRVKVGLGWLVCELYGSTLSRNWHRVGGTEIPLAAVCDPGGTPRPAPVPC